jgi:hypothetical protein
MPHGPKDTIQQLSGPYRLLRKACLGNRINWGMV